MVQPQYDDTDFVALPVEVFDITITVFDAGVFTVELDGGPYTGSGATITLARDALLTSIQGGTHPNYTAASQATDAIRITSTGPGQFIGGTPNCTYLKLIAPGGGAMTKTVITAHEGVVFGVLYQAILNDGAISTPLEPLRTAIRWVALDAFPRVLQINFTVDPLPAPEKTALDALVAAFVIFDVAPLIIQWCRTAEQDVQFAHLGPNIGLATKGAPDFGLKLINLDTSTIVQEASGDVGIAQAVYFRSNTKVSLARANNTMTTRAKGLVIVAALDTFAATVQTSGHVTFTTDQWDAVTGQTGGLSPGVRYFLSPDTAGAMEPAPPSATSGEWRVLLGTALTSTIMKLDTQPAFLLA